ncbi:MAG: T9SS type A sorting domain-containing protein [Saprospiraceae bacterium]|nr:T9SS type A sorting domain-containing protein [Saprospiraceae bacterium]
MKKALNFILLTFLYGSISAQTDTFYIKPFKMDFDSIHAPLLVDSFPYNRLYDRVFPWASLDMTASGDTTDFNRFRQGWYELELSRRNLMSVPPYSSYRRLVDSSESAGMNDRILLSAIAVKMAVIDTLAYRDGRLDSTSLGWAKVTGWPSPYLIKDVTMGAISISQLETGKKYRLELKSTHIQNTDRLTVQSIQVTEPVNGINITLTPGASDYLELSDTGKFFITVRINFSGGSYFINKQEITVRDLPPPRDPCNGGRVVIESDIPWQGPGEDVATTSLADVYFYYHLDENGDCEQILKKPIIICDGYDPQDSRDISEIEGYFIFEDLNSNLIDGIGKLRSLGFDIIIMNFPKIGSEQVEYRSGVRIPGGTYVNRHGRDGGSDYTERNAMLMVKLIQMVNAELAINSSTEKLCILGPSGGGQVTRYALAYMEKQHAASVPDMEHNTRVWCSFDSPHHGANIPVGSMLTLAELGTRFNNADALEKFKTKINTNGARQYLITQVGADLISDPGFPFGTFIEVFQNSSSPVRQAYLNSVSANGESGSDGWPVNVRRITVANASDQGVLTGTPGQQIIRIKGKTGVLFRAIDLTVKYMDDYNLSSKVLDLFVRKDLFTSSSISYTIPNDNPAGALDVLPGSKLNSTEEVFNGILEGINKTRPKITVTELSLFPNHTFMPVISSLAFNSTNVDWGQVLNNRDLVCTGEIPFHAYKISGSNQDHITITEDIYNWLEYQFVHGDAGCDPVCGTFSITGDQSICDGNTSTVHTYTFNGGIGTGETLTWTVTGDLAIDNTSGNTAGIKITAANGSGMVTATLINACGDRVVQNFQVQVGKPNIYLTSALDEDECRFLVTINTTPTGKIPLSYQWSTNGVSYTNGAVSKEFWLPPHHTSMWVYARADWGCGYTADDILLEFPENSNCDDIWPSPPLSNSDANSNGKFLLTPNPTLSGWNLTFPQELKDDLYISLFDMNNRLLFKNKVENISNNIFIEGENLTPGIYIINISNQKNNFTMKALKL